MEMDRQFCLDQSLLEESPVFTDSTPAAHAANSILNYYRNASTLTIKKILQDELFMKATFDGQKSALIQCLRYMIDQGMVMMVEEGNLSDDSPFVLKEKKNDKRTIKELRLLRIFNSN